MSASTPPLQPLSVTPEGAAELTGLSVRSFRRWRSEGTGPAFIRISENKILYKIRDLERWLDEQAAKR